LRTLPGQQAQCDWAHFGSITIGKATRTLMAFVMVLSYSRHLFLRFYLNAAMNNFLRGHVEAFAAWGVPRVVLYDFVPGNKIIVMCPSPLCGGEEPRRSFVRVVRALVGT
jgi:transposase